MKKKEVKVAAKKPVDPTAAAPPGSGIFGLSDSLAESKVVLMPVPWEVTTSYRGGTAKGPAAILQASHQVELYAHGYGNPYKAGIHMLPMSQKIRALNVASRPKALKVIKAGEEAVAHSKTLKRLQHEVNLAGGELNRIVYRKTKELLALGKLVGVVGGDHSVPYGAIKAIAETVGKEGFGILHVDAHMDLRVRFEGFDWSHASIMHNVMRDFPEVTRLVQVGIRGFCEDEMLAEKASNRRIHTLYQEDLARELDSNQTWHEICDEAIKHLPRNVYLSFDIDGLSETLCPNTGTPVPGGLSWSDALVLISQLHLRHRIIGFDLNEVSPGELWKPGNPDTWDANVGASLLYKMIGAMLLSHQE